MTEVQDDAPVTTAKGPGKIDDAVAHLIQDRADTAKAARDREALMAGQSHIFSSSKNKVQVAAADGVPQCALADRQRKMATPGSAEHQGTVELSIVRPSAFAASGGCLWSGNVHGKRAWTAGIATKARLV